jgi:MoaA/NifB/PqqE/SkfB family radical SAM enzyme
MKSSAVEQSILAVLGLLSRGGSGVLERIASTASRLAPSAVSHPILSAALASIIYGDDGQAMPLLRRVAAELSPHARKRLVKTLVVNGMLEAPTRRARFAAEHGFDPPLTILISPTNRCNLRCPGCYAAGFEREKELSYDILDKILAEVRSMGALYVGFSGGEPLVRKDDLFRLMGEYDDLFFIFYTNGTLMTESDAAELHRLGNVAPIFSLEGFEKATDARRGKGTFRAVMEKMDMLRALGAPFGTSMTVTSRNVDEITSLELFGELYRRGVMVSWLFLYMPVGREPDVSLMPTPEQRERLRQGAAGIRARYPVFVMEPWGDAPWAGGCIGAGRVVYHINAHGDVEPCVFAHYAKHNVHESSLTEALAGDFFKAFRAWRPEKGNPLTPCIIIDYPEHFRNLVRSHVPYATRPNSDSILNSVGEDLDRYGEGIRAFHAETWEKIKDDYPVTWGGKT